MADINHVVLVGRLTRDAELKYTASGQAVCKFSLAINRRRKNGDQWENEANYFDIVLWGKMGEAVAKLLVKGKAVGVDGELRQDRWQQQDGQNRSKVEIVASNVQLLGGNPGSGSGEYNGPSNGGSYGSSGSGQGDYPPENRGGEAPAGDDGFSDDIPF
ncbi:single-stranded DNA-binding protein [Leadbettera azotonutricia]|uniref:Single-stranded DNA-binding protein n=1 Tax=Leadbettera azotonutricia (strain ATCC BAA-888 / DSM 13862 / ZAS-9) TaxID=545695 RepID=F5YAZ8_LEAAZ|nr:single-stranded DNA-binding protein [Leadbettera azotonutricia]AEF83021.1 single-stranded DNA-binding protein [Leadbettera azotonutricia ZAS-9]